MIEAATDAVDRGHPGAAVALADALYPWLTVRADPDRGVAVHALAVGAARALGDPAVIAIMLRRLAGTHLAAGAHRRAAPLVAEALLLAGSRPGDRAEALVLRGRLAGARGDHAEALAHLADARDLHLLAGRPRGVALALAATAQSLLCLGRVDDARDALHTARHTVVDVAVPHWEHAAVLVVLVRAWVAAGRVADAVDLARQLVDHLTALGYGTTGALAEARAVLDRPRAHRPESRATTISAVGESGEDTRVQEAAAGPEVTTPPPTGAPDDQPRTPESESECRAGGAARRRSWVGSA
ncbi:hypothetical protein [Actinokineospora cianjurensis]|uniref:hypothetical protein n=1 Tax=Actinokineospora cianjurensis TaxID=585224 RepID=UPI0011C40211|nr:hypothetical protein [Actinokineospora cianjurensis]